MNPLTDDILAAIRPLRLIFWGGLICIFDFTLSSTVNGTGWKVDLISDLVGMLMITWAVFRLSRYQVAGPYRGVMTFLKIIAVVSCFVAFHDHFIYSRPTMISLVLSVVGLAAAVATVLFCQAMRWLCNAGGLERSAESWMVTFFLFLSLVLIPLGLMRLVVLYALVGQRPFDLSFGIVTALFALVAFSIPFVHLFISTSRMKEEIALRWRDEKPEVVYR